MCTPTRSALLTGRIPVRTGCYNGEMLEPDAVLDWVPVFYPRSYGMLPQSEILLSEVLKQQGYVNGMFGKWHLGSINATALPLQRGFDRYWGMPYSSDMGCPPGIGYPCLNTAGPAGSWVPGKEHLEPFIQYPQDFNSKQCHCMIITISLNNQVCKKQKFEYPDLY